MSYNLMKDYLLTQIKYHDEVKDDFSSPSMKNIYNYHFVKAMVFTEVLTELTIIQDQLDKSETK